MGFWFFLIRKERKNRFRGKITGTQMEKDLLGSISVLISSRTTFLPILSVKESKCFTRVSFKSSLFFFFTVKTALTLNLTAFSAGTAEAFIKSSLTAATGCLTTLLKCNPLFSRGTQSGLPRSWFLCWKPWFKSTFEEETKEDPSTIEQPMISLTTAICDLYKK